MGAVTAELGPWFGLPGRDVATFGLWDRCTTPDAGKVASFTPDWAVCRLARRLPPVILEPGEWSAWLDPGQDARELMAAVRPERFELQAN